MARKELYQIRKTDNSHWRILKCDEDFNPTGEYQVSKTGSHLECSCFASNKPICRHRIMVPEFEVENRFDSHWWYSFDKKKWVEGPKQEA